jgi:hypothetical protein
MGNPGTMTISLFSKSYGKSLQKFSEPGFPRRRDGVIQKACSFFEDFSVITLPKMAPMT